MNRKLLALTTVMFIVLTVIISSSAIGNVNNSINARKGLAKALLGQRVSSELDNTIEEGKHNEYSRVWIEFDPEDYENKTGTSIVQLIKKYKRSGMEKVQAKASSELLASEIIALIYCYAEAIEPPIELVKRQRYLVWYTTYLTPTMINAVADFPGVQKITPFRPQNNISKVDPIFVSYIQKVNEEYPQSRIKLIVGLKDLPDNVADHVCYENVNEVVRKYGSEISKFWDQYTMMVTAPPSLQLVAELSALQNVQRITPNWVYYWPAD